MKDPFDRKQCVGQLLGFLEHFVTSCSFYIQENEVSSPFANQGHGVCCAHISLPGLTLSITNTDNPLLARLHRQPLCTELSIAYKGIARRPWILSQLVMGIFHSIQLDAEAHAWPDDPLKCLTSVGKRVRRLDQAVADQIRAMPMRIVRNPTRAAKLLKAFGFQYTHRTWMDFAYMKRYILAMRGQLPSLSYGITCDKSRGRSKDWLATNILGHEARKTGWAQPVAVRGIIKSRRFF